MPLIEHENPELQRHALQCVSKIMVQNWEVSYFKLLQSTVSHGFFQYVR